MDLSEEIPYSLHFERRCEVSEQKCMLCAQLLAELLPFASLPNLRHFQRVIFCADDAMEQTINDVLREQKNPGSYLAGLTSASATAVPLELNGSLRCSIILSHREVEPLEPEHYHSWQLVSSLLEELLHIRIYSTAWEQRGYVHPPLSLPPHEKDLLSMCTILHDEYMVARWKTAIMGNTPLVDVEGGFSTAYPAYGNLVAPMLEQAALSLRQATRSSLTPSGKTQLLRIVYREVFEPLARNAGFQSETPPAELRYENNPAESAFFQKHVAAFWYQIKEQLERSFESSLADMDDALDAIVKIVSNFLEYIEGLYRQ